jgi:hypothetical protein
MIWYSSQAENIEIVYCRIGYLAFAEWNNLISNEYKTKAIHADNNCQKTSKRLVLCPKQDIELNIFVLLCI